MLNDTTIEKFKTSLRGELLQRGNERYDDARKLWNGMFDRWPALIARCAGTADVISAVNFARDNRLQVAVRGGGHSWKLLWRVDCFEILNGSSGKDIKTN